jgi:hypothetical protein
MTVCCLVCLMLISSVNNLYNITDTEECILNLTVLQAGVHLSAPVYLDLANITSWYSSVTKVTGYEVRFLAEAETVLFVTA